MDVLKNYPPLTNCFVLTVCICQNGEIIPYRYEKLIGELPRFFDETERWNECTLVGYAVYRYLSHYTHDLVLSSDGWFAEGYIKLFDDRDLEYLKG